MDQTKNTIWTIFNKMVLTYDISYTITLFPNVKISPTMCHDGHNLSLGLKQELQQEMEKGLGRRPRHDMAQTHSQGELEMCESARVKPPRCLTFPI